MICTSFRAYEENTLRGFCDLYLERIRATIRDCTYHVKNDEAWVGLPGVPYKIEGQEKPGYKAVLVFDDDVKYSFRDAAVDAVKAKIEEMSHAKSSPSYPDDGSGDVPF
jgi:hypothetical protein|tara:strand:+ start:1012 stop:1338 length:327 start_codon:yes stop_codon:yes gene_type:complete